MEDKFLRPLQKKQSMIYAPTKSTKWTYYWYGKNIEMEIQILSSLKERAVTYRSLLIFF